MVDYNTVQELENNTEFNLDEFRRALLEDIESVRDMLESTISDIGDIEYNLDDIDEESDPYDIEDLYGDYETALAYIGLKPSSELEQMTKVFY